MACDQLHSSDLIEEKESFVVECVGQVYDLKVSDEFNSHHFMAQTQEEQG